MTYSVKAATEYGIGGGVNGTGKRQRVSGFYVMDPTGRPARAFTGQHAEQKATEWAIHCNEKLVPQYFPHLVR